MTTLADGVVPFVDLAAVQRALEVDIHAVVAETMARGDYILGEQTALFEAEFARYCGVGYGIGVDSGTSALELILRGLGIGPGDEVITAANSFVASAFAISHVGAAPVFADVDPVTLNIDPDALEAAVTSRTRAIMPVHLYGRLAPMDAILAVADRHGLAVVEDACQAHGAALLGRRAGSFGAAAAFSFYPSKNLGAIGDGGLVVTSDPALAERIRRLRNYGCSAKYVSETLGYNKRLDELQAAVLRLKLPHLDAWNSARRIDAQDYMGELAALPAVGLPEADVASASVWHLFVVQVDDRDAVRDHLIAQGVQSGIHYPIPIPFQPAYAALGILRGAYPITEAAAERILSLPMYPGLGPGRVRRVAHALELALAGAEHI